MNEELKEITWLAGIVGLLFFYHIFLFLMVWKKPLLTAAGQNGLVRKAWIAAILEDRKDVLAVQTLRNVMMSSSLLATTALTISTIIAAFFIRGPEGTSKIVEMSDETSEMFSVEHKLFSMILLFMLSFFSYMQSVRIHSHAGYMFGISKCADKPSFLTEIYLWKLLDRGSFYHTIGTRLFYAAFLAVLWLFGPIISAVCAGVLLVALIFTDFPSRLEEEKELFSS